MDLFYHVAPENEVKQYADDMHHLESDLRILKDIRDKSQSLSKKWPACFARGPILERYCIRRCRSPLD